MEILKQKTELSVIICTRNRAKQLTTVLQCLGTQKNIENLNWEIVIVDNNSNDNTKEVSYAFCEGSNLKINYVFESNIGLSNARNTGVSASKGSYILFLDDDVLIPKEFICNALFGLSEFNEFDIFGYRVLPDWETKQLNGQETQVIILKKPFWATFKKPFNLIQSFLPIHDLGGEPLQYPNRRAKNPIGASFLVKKEVFEKLGSFRDDLGAGQSGVCEDTEFFWYAMLKNYKILYWPYASLYHPVTKERLSIGYLHKWYFNLGKSLYLVKSKGRLNQELHDVKSLPTDGGDELKKLFQNLSTQRSKNNISILAVPGYLWMKLLLILLLLPLSAVLLFIKRPLYLSTLLLKTIGEIKQAVVSN